MYEDRIFVSSDTILNPFFKRHSPRDGAAGRHLYRRRETEVLQKHLPPSSFVQGYTFPLAADLGQGAHRGEPEVLKYLDEN